MYKPHIASTICFSICYNLIVAYDSSFTSVILTYKGKILLLGADIIGIDKFDKYTREKIGKNLWRFIAGKKTGRESFDQAMIRGIKYITKLELRNIKPLETSLKNKSKHFYHVELTDKEVNTMERREGQKLEFYTLMELRKMSLADTTAAFLEEYKYAVESLVSHKAILQT